MSFFLSHSISILRSKNRILIVTYIENQKYIGLVLIFAIYGLIHYDFFLIGEICVYQIVCYMYQLDPEFHNLITKQYDNKSIV